MFKRFHFFCAVRAFEIMKNRGQRSWSVGLSVADITNSVLTDKKKTHSVSTLAQVVQWHLTVMCCVALVLHFFYLKVWLSHPQTSGFHKKTFHLTYEF